jgi:hypothetical protein
MTIFPVSQAILTITAAEDVTKVDEKPHPAPQPPAEKCVLGVASTIGTFRRKPWKN